MRHAQTTLLGLVLLLNGCTTSTFKLTDDSAVDRVMHSKRFAELQRVNPTRLSCEVEGEHANVRDVCVSEDHPDHTARVAAFRVTWEGRVWMNEDPMGARDQWAVVE